MNVGVVLLIALSGWALLSIVVSIAVGGMAKGRDEGSVLTHPVFNATNNETVRREAGAVHEKLAS